MSLFRWILGLPFAAITTAGLFFAMAQMIKQRNDGFPPARPAIDLKITPRKPEPPVVSEPPRKTIPDKMPATELDFPAPSGSGERMALKPGPVKIEHAPPNPGKMSGAIIRIPPPYPENCRSRNAEGVVIVEFDVTPKGNVINPRIIHSDHGCFNRTVIKTVSGWKYPPSASGAKRYGLVERFSFRLED